MKTKRGLFLVVLAHFLMGVQVFALDFSVRNVTLEQAIATLNRNSGYSIVLSSSDIDLKKTVTVDVKDATINQIIDRLFEGQDVTYSIEGNKIAVSKVRRQSSAKMTATAVHSVSGTVKGSDGLPVIGAAIIEKDGKGRAVTDNDGHYAIDLMENSEIEVSCLGYAAKTIRAGNSSKLDIVLDLSNEMLEDVVVIGYGTQKKVDLTGSISSVNVAEITESRPLTNLSNVLAGMASGVSVTSSSNKPGTDDATILVRGQGTLNTSTPLVIVDGAEGSFNSVNPQDVESVTVLKDAASAAIYGSRAANGVILITTKAGREGTMKVNYHGYVSVMSAKKNLNMVTDYADYMEYANEAESNSNLTPYFSKEMIDLWRADNGQNPLKYPNTDWFDATFKTNVATNHIISVNGGTKQARYYVSLGYSNNPGVMDNSGERKFTVRANFDANITKWFAIGLKINANRQDLDNGTNLMGDVFSYMFGMPPGCVAQAPDGRFGYVQNPEDNPQKSSYLASLYTRDGTNNRHTFRGDAFITITPLKGLSVTGTYRYSISDGQQKFKPAFFDKWNFLTETIGTAGGGRTYVNNYFSRATRPSMDLIARYEHKFFSDRLGFNVMAGASQESYSSETTTTQRYDLIDESLTVLDACTGESSATGSISEWAMRSYFGRLNLNWDDKYLLEANVRADGSSRFRPKYRWGVFPSVSAGWRISEEPWLKGSFVNNLKLRASWGGLGNNSVNNYSSLAVYSKSNYSWGDQLAVGMIQAALANESMTWETTYVTDLGVDFGFFRNRLSGTVDAFIKRTEGILITLPAPAVHGTSTIPTTNAAVVSNKGIEVALNWNDHVGDFHYGINANFTYVKNNVDKFKGNDYSLSGASMIKEGLPINAQYGYVVDRIVQTTADMNVVNKMLMNNPDAFKSLGKPSYGDFLYKDLNKDGIINDKDREILSDGPTPKYLFGVNLSASWKGIDFSMLLQGQAGAKVIYYQDVDGLTPVYRWGYAINKDAAEGAWREGRTDATWPRLTDYTYSLNTKLSDFYLEDLSFLKIRNIQIGYTLPDKWLKKINFDKIRFYCTLENFFTFTKYRLLDPEVNKMDYPTIRQAVIGLNITF